MNEEKKRNIKIGGGDLGQGWDIQLVGKNQSSPQNLQPHMHQIPICGTKHFSASSVQHICCFSHDVLPTLS